MGRRGCLGRLFWLPMALLGGDFDLVCATGLTEERFPRKAVDNPLLTDEMVAQLQEAGARLVGSEQRQHVERRRFSALVAAAQGRLAVLLLLTPIDDEADVRRCGLKFDTRLTRRPNVSNGKRLNIPV